MLSIRLIPLNLVVVYAIRRYQEKGKVMTHLPIMKIQLKKQLLTQLPLLHQFKIYTFTLPYQKVLNPTWTVLSLQGNSPTKIQCLKNVYHI